MTFFRSREPQKPTFVAVFVLRRCAKHLKAVKIAVMVIQIQISEVAWFKALFIEANYSILLGESHAFSGESYHVIPQGLRYLLR